MSPLLFAAVLLALACIGLIAYAFKTSREAQQSVRDANAANASLAAARDNFREQLRALSESSGAGIIVLSPQGKIIHANATADQILGREHDSTVGHSLIQATLSSEMQDFVLNAARSGLAQTRDFQLPGALSRTLRASIYTFQQGLSGTSECMLVLVDITELRRLETMRRDFVANVSHELRTPLASIRAMAETLQDGALHDDEVADRFLGTIISESDRLARISEDLLILSDAESKEPPSEPFDLAQLLNEVVTRSQPHAIERGIDLSLSTSGSLPVRGSVDQIEQVLVNLVDNAIKYTPQEGKVVVTASQLPEGTRVTVSDTGIGIMEEHLPRIFERFYRVDKARSRESGGTGLGLSIVKNIVEAHGGEVGVESRFNHGSTFSITLPTRENHR